MTRPPAARGLRAVSPLHIALAAGVIACTVQMLWVRRYFASMPYWDEWNDLYGFLEVWRGGGLTWQGLFAQHMEHRIPVARVCFILVDVIFGEGNQLGILTLHAVLMGAIVTTWTYALRRLGEPLWLVAATLVVLMSPSQHQNWLWGFQVEFFTLVGPVVAAVCWIALAPRITWAGVAGCVLACEVSSYSLASGISSWAAIGLLLFVRVCLDRGWSWRGLVGARREAAQLLAFLAPGILVAATYFQHYVQLTPPNAAGRSVGQMAQWTVVALVFPLIDPLAAGDLRWLPAAVALVFAPIAAAMVLYVRRGDRARLLLMAGVLLMVIGNVAIFAFGRSGWALIAPRYGTVCLWTGAISLMAIATLVRASREWWRPAAIPIGLAAAVLLGAHLWRYAAFLDEMKQSQADRLVWTRNMVAYLSDAAPDRQLPAAIPFPEAPIKPLLQRPPFLATLPYNLRPPARVSTAGDAWSLDGVTPGAGVPGLFAWGSWSGSDARTGTLTSTPFAAPRGLTVAVSGYPTRPGNSLAIESVPDPTVRILYSGPDPGDRWIEWRVDLDRFPPGRVRVVAVDGRQSDGAWLGIRFPADLSVSVHALEAVVRNIVSLSVALLVFIGGWAYWRPGRSLPPVAPAVSPVAGRPVPAVPAQAHAHKDATARPPAPRVARGGLFVALAGGVIAVTAQMFWVRQFYVSVPYWDEWSDLHGFLATWHTGGVTWHGLFAQHLEHRIPVARVCFILVDAVFGEGNMLGNLTLHAVLMGGIVMTWVYTLRRLGEPLWLVAATLIVLLSPSQYENWLWGFQVEFFTLVGPVVAAVCWIALAPRLTWAGVAGCIVACAVSSYSIVSGISSWAAIGSLLLIRIRLDRGSWRGGDLESGARRETAQVLAFLAAGVFVTVAYFHGYARLAPTGTEARTLGEMARWIAVALAFPLIDPMVAADVPWLPAAVVLVVAPIAAAMVLYARRGDRARLLLTAGVLLMVAGNLVLMALGRAGVVFVASRYGTVCLWTGAISLMAMANLARATSDRRRPVAMVIGLAGAMLLGVHLWRYTTFVRPMQDTRSGRLEWERNVVTYLSDDSPDRQLPANMPFPGDKVKPLLHVPSFLATLPYNLRPPVRVLRSGDAWSLNGAPPAAGTAGSFTWASWSGSDAHTGTLTSSPFPAPRELILAVSGYPTRSGNSLAIESVSAPNVRLVYSGPDPGDSWIKWRVDRDRLPPGRLRVVAVDGRQADGAWVGIRFPEDKPRAARVLEAGLRHLGAFSVVMLALMGGWACRRPRGVRS